MTSPTTHSNYLKTMNLQVISLALDGRTGRRGVAVVEPDHAVAAVGRHAVAVPDGPELALPTAVDR